MMDVLLSHVRNPDIPGGYWSDAAVRIPSSKRRAVKDLLEAVHVVLWFIDRNGLGGGNWSGGEVRRDGVVIARVSYNGRVWTPHPFESPEHREIDPVTGELKVFGACVKCGDAGIGETPTHDRGWVALCEQHMHPWRHAKAGAR